jgi:hypothetical protein
VFRIKTKNKLNALLSINIKILSWRKLHFILGVFNQFLKLDWRTNLTSKWKILSLAGFGASLV